MSQMHQIQLSYVSTEDRILFRMNTKSRQEFRFWMTRRYTGILWSTLARVLEEAGKGAEDAPPEPTPGEVAAVVVRERLDAFWKERTKFDAFLGSVKVIHRSLDWLMARNPTAMKDRQGGIARWPY